VFLFLRVLFSSSNAATPFPGFARWIFLFSVKVGLGPSVNSRDFPSGSGLGVFPQILVVFLPFRDSAQVFA